MHQPVYITRSLINYILVKQVWGPKTGSYEFKPVRLSTNDDGMFSPLNSRPTLSLDKNKMGSSFVVHEQ